MQSQNNIQIFENKEFGQIRTIEIDGQSWFIGKDVADILGYTNSRKALSTHVDDEDKLTYRFVTSGQNRAIKVLQGQSSFMHLYRLTPLAFEPWVTTLMLLHWGHFTSIFAMISSSLDLSANLLSSYFRAYFSLCKERPTKQSQSFC